MKGKDVQKISSAMGLSENRLWQVFNHGLQRLEESTSIIAENERLANENAIMKDAYVNVSPRTRPKKKKYYVTALYNFHTSNNEMNVLDTSVQMAQFIRFKVYDPI